MWQANMSDVLGNKTYRAYKKYQVVMLLCVVLSAIATSLFMILIADSNPTTLGEIAFEVITYFIGFGLIIMGIPYGLFSSVIDKVKSRKKEYIIEYMRVRLGEDGQK